ncbi:membrane protein insertion efficiency factor YidD [Phytoactinopolyspora mesophila]|uniref:Putative membrane protein insertion efficiency factor n=1 Tax=Phytoactinopolyspora mesophila TaxID=2650750 RepID=A0A7K3M3J4_9ACTN|nr:membrane protein insertion efficiency factor YidD [Phytoactinopolyspora mesophila]
MSRLLIAVLKLYRLISSQLYGPTCRYYPSCSAYALGSLETHGAVRGSWLSLRRLGRCHPWCEGGVDLVPTRANYLWWGRAAGTDGEDESSIEDTRITPVSEISVCRGA